MSDPRPLGPADGQTHGRGWRDKPWAGYALAASSVAACALMTYALQQKLIPERMPLEQAFFDPEA